MRLPAFRVEARQLVLAQQESGGSPAQQMTLQGVSLAGEESPSPSAG
jgi:hypothetical protein